jgi:hypothetical protein
MTAKKECDEDCISFLRADQELAPEHLMAEGHSCVHCERRWYTVNANPARELDHSTRQQSEL